MSQYSQLVGSFQRTGNFPMEADYIFGSLEELNEWASKPVNKSTLHTGLQKVVKTEEGQFIYWVVERNGDLVFEKYNCLGSEESFRHLDITDTEYKDDDQILVITLKQGDDVWNEFIPLGSIVQKIKDDFAESISHDSQIESLTNAVEKLKGEVAALISTAGGTVTDLKILSFRFLNTTDTTYVINPNLLTEEQLENGIDIPLKWEYNINLSDSDRQYVIVNGEQIMVPKGSDEEFTLTGVKKNTNVQLYGISKIGGLEAKSNILKITFGITIFIGGASSDSVVIDSLGTQVLIPEIDPATGKQFVKVPFEQQGSDDKRTVAIPSSTFTNPIVRDQNGFLINGYTVKQQVAADGTEYTVYQLTNVLHGEFYLIITEK